LQRRERERHPRPLSHDRHVHASLRARRRPASGGSDRSGCAIDDWAAICEADLEFHKSIVALRTSPRLVRTFQSIRSELTFCLTLITAEERRMGRTDRLVNEHREIRDAIVARDSASAGRLVGDHLDFYEAETRRSLANRP
jgi:DNA-binding FadR family transcriptional regulator